MGDWKFGPKSLKELEGVHPELIDVVEAALKLSDIDFAVHDGLRTKAEQAALVKAGASKTMDSRHITGHATDLVPYVNGKMRWEWKPIYHIAGCMRKAALDLRTRIRWGGVWDKELQDLTGDLEAQVNAYGDRRRALGRGVFTDGPHFELPVGAYPVIK